MSRREHSCEHGQGRVEPVRGARPVQAVGDAVEIVLAAVAQVRALGQVLTQQRVGVLARASLPRTVRVAAVNLHASALRQIPVTAQLLALVVGGASAQRRGNRARRPRARSL